MTLQPYKHSLPTYQPIVLFFKNYLPMVRTNLKRATALLVTDQKEPLALLVKAWQIQFPGLILEVLGLICLRAGDNERKTLLVTHWVYCSLLLTHLTTCTTEASSCCLCITVLERS